ncbi:hypothetical protein CEK71_00695 [Methylovulum psychrotolerans]|jgi:hypothetical protein|uniref:Uncharacterized protein n=1 Tax=Methylovulum psychrotolerans TaxID=1704499 RepID=A0A1Z4BTV6_9GAMM|nr:hypothetical protein CEK71_00695 [Methylovulum psychrotolerans]
MKLLLTAIGLSVFLAGCAVQPVGVGIRPAAVVRPAYPIPGPGYLWRQHPTYGWGWYHPGMGWHRGWR